MRIGIVLTLALLSLWPSLTRAQQQPQGQSTGGQATPAQQPWSTNIGPLYSPPFGTDHLLGDWVGARTWLENQGIDVGVNYFGQTAAVVTGPKQGIDNTSQIGLSIDLDGEKLLGLPGFAIHSVIVQRNGRSASDEFLNDDLDAVQQIFGGGGNVIAHLVYLYAEQTLYNGRVDLAAGRLPVGNYFASSPLYCEFMNVIFCGNPHPLPVYPGEPDWPAATWGGMGRVIVAPTVYVMAGLFQVNPSFGGNSGWAWFQSGSTGVSVPVEVGWVPSFGPNHLIGHYKFGFDWDTSSYPDLFVGSDGQPIALTGQTGQPHNGRGMYYVFADQMFVRNGEGDTNGLIAFGGFVHADRDTSPLENQVFGGVSETASFIGRPKDLLGFAASWFQVSGALTGTQQLEQEFGLPLTGGGLGTPLGVQSSEAELEAMYTAAVYRGVSLEPDIQYIIHPGGTSRRPNALVIGLTTNVTF